jgi:uncharacterized membrane-anchored protein YhcB (DUF1043 family)
MFEFEMIIIGIIIVIGTIIFGFLSIPTKEQKERQRKLEDLIAKQKQEKFEEKFECFMNQSEAYRDEYLRLVKEKEEKREHQRAYFDVYGIIEEQDNFETEV